MFSDAPLVDSKESKVAEIGYPQAIAFDADIITLDKEAWFSELFAAKQEEGIKALLYDKSVNRKDDSEENPTTSNPSRKQINR